MSSQPQGVTHPRLSDSRRFVERIVGAMSTVYGFYRMRPVPGASDSTSAKAISFNDLLRELRADWRVWTTTLGIGLATGIMLAAIAPLQYTAVLKIAQADSSFSDHSSSSAGKGVVSALLQGSVDVDQFTDYSQFLSLLHSVRLAKRLDAKYGLMKQVFPTDPKNGKFVSPPGVSAWLKRAGLWLLGQPPWEPPGYVDLANYLTSAIKIDNASGSTATLSYTAPTAKQAGSFLSHAFAQTDDLMREEKLGIYIKQRQYVANRLLDTSTLDQRAFLISLWGQQEAKILLLTSGDPVGARMIDDLNVPNTPDSQAGKLLAISTVLGLFLGLLITIIRSALRRA